MRHKRPSELGNLPVYRKALDILILSQNISFCLSEDLSSLNSDGKEDPCIYVSGDIVQHSTHLAPHILKVELEQHEDKKYKHLENLDRLTSKLYSSCRRLERSKSKNRDYLPLLRKEIKKFRALKRHWMLSL